MLPRISGTASTQTTKPPMARTVHELTSAATLAAFDTPDDFRKSRPSTLTKAKTMIVPVPGPIRPL